MNLEEMERIAAARTKGEWAEPFNGCLLDDDWKFIQMAANNWDKLMAVIKAADNLYYWDRDANKHIFRAFLVSINELKEALEELERIGK